MRLSVVRYGKEVGERDLECDSKRSTWGRNKLEGGKKRWEW